MARRNSKRRGSRQAASFIRRRGGATRDDERTAGPASTPKPEADDKRFRRILETTHEGIWMADLNGVTTFANPQMARILRCTPKEMIGRSAFDFVFEEDHPTVRQHFESYLQNPAGRDLEERLRRKDGTEAWALVSASVFGDGKTEPRNFLGMFTDITERKHVQRALQESEASLQLQISRMPIGHVLWSPEFHVLSWNPAAERIFGFSRAAALGKSPYELIVSKEVQPQVEEIWRRLLEGDSTAHSVNANVTRGGETIICEWFNTPIKKADGRVVGVLSMVQDVTRRQRAEEALRLNMEMLETRVEQRTLELQQSNLSLAASEEKYRQLFATVADAILLIDAESRRFLEVNEAAILLYRHTREEFLDLRLDDVTTEAADTEATFQLCLAHGSLRIPLRYHRKKDGTVFPVEISASAFSVNGRRMVCGLVRDISLRKQAEEILTRRERELADFFADAPLGMLWVAPEGRILRVNQAQAAMLGEAPGEIFGRQVTALFVQPALACELLERLARSETVQNARFRLKHKGGKSREVLVDANGQFEGQHLVQTRWFVRDITRSLELEREILNISEREQRRFAQDLHDDLCQQLVGIEFLTQRLGARLQSRGDKVFDQAMEIADLVKSALIQTRDLARGLSPVGLKPAGLEDALRELAARTRKVFGIRCQLHCAGPVAIPDPDLANHLYRIAQEAVSNSVKYSGATRISIQLSNGDGELVLKVTDDGTGFRHRRANRSGMGLRTMNHRAEVVGGTLAVEQRRMGGVSVTCRVPCTSGMILGGKHD
jgi:PAS domain S-box-containing protein